MNVMMSESLAIRVLEAVKGSMTRSHYKEMQFLLTEGEYGIVLDDGLKTAVNSHIPIAESILNDLEKFLDGREPVRHVPAFKLYLEQLRNSVSA